MSNILDNKDIKNIKDNQNILDNLKIQHCQDVIELYKKSLNNLEKKAFIIAQSNLESSFSMEKSIGFLEFKKSIQP
tara:strand:+ start:6347 stop:6574 length:228 start_codon:yes stop_codon:yes gene_type:complete